MKTNFTTNTKITLTEQEKERLRGRVEAISVIHAMIDEACQEYEKTDQEMSEKFKQQTGKDPIHGPAVKMLFMIFRTYIQEALQEAGERLAVEILEQANVPCGCGCGGKCPGTSVKVYAGKFRESLSSFSSTEVHID